MRLYFSLLRGQLVPMVMIIAVYSATLLALMWQINSNCIIWYKINPYEYGSEPVDFFFGLLVFIPFAVPIFNMKKENYLDYVSLRTSKRKYVQSYITATTMCFITVVFVKVMGDDFPV